MSREITICKERGITEKESRTISVIRTVAMLSIVMCHYIQWFGRWSFLGQFFNVGVPLFFIISGFLYGQKNIENVWSWYKKQFIKIVIPLYMYYIMVGVILAVIGKMGGYIPQKLYSNCLIYKDL